MYGDKMHTETIKEVLNLLKEKMKAQHISQKIIESKLDLSKAGVSHILNGRNRMSLVQFMKICDCLGIRPSEILSNVGQ